MCSEVGVALVVMLLPSEGQRDLILELLLHIETGKLSYAIFWLLRP